MITVNNLSVSYPGKIEALQDISLSLPGGGITGIIGPNGAGKSTLMKAILGLINYSGQVKIDTADANSKATAIAYVEQRSSIDLNFPITVSECVLLGTYGKLGFFKK
ncbi:metal cation ABC transporter ATP-binding protein [Streptococcus parauberis KCTC 11537]|nr:metal cation ABC transporter ATP-binding protein [Streptococcus parauberis KCTC 11537]